MATGKGSPLPNHNNISFPQLSAMTQGFSLGRPRSAAISPKGDTVLFLRASNGFDACTNLWRYDIATKTEKLLVDASKLILGGEELPPEEKARRERLRERAGGITSYTLSAQGSTVVFALSGKVYATTIATGQTSEVVTAFPAIDPRPNEAGTYIAYVHDGSLHVVRSDGTGDTVLAAAEGENVTYGMAEFIAAEEMDRSKGFWWSPDGDQLLVARVDNSKVQTVYISDPAQPTAAPSIERYPMAGTPNAAITLSIVNVQRKKIDIAWDSAKFPYLAAVHWSSYGNPLLQVQSRDQKTSQFLIVDPKTGKVTCKREITDPSWTDIESGIPAWTPQGNLVTIEPDGGSYRLMVDGKSVTPVGMEVRGVNDIGKDDILFSASTTDSTQVQLFRLTAHGIDPVSKDSGYYAGVRSGSVTVVQRSSMDSNDTTMSIYVSGTQCGEIASYAVQPPFEPHVQMLTVGARKLRCALLLPQGYKPTDGPLPVLLDPYGGPHSQRVLQAKRMYLTSQWFADQGFAVLVTDGRGTPGRGPQWDRAIKGDVATPVLEDQIDALHAVAKDHPELDLSRVAIRGWSFGGYLAALAVLRRPDVFHAAVAGAPVTDWRLYDTHYTERYLGNPAEDDSCYKKTSLLTDASKLQRPLMLIHGLADDNVMPANTLQLSTALLNAGKPHTVLPLSGGVTHMASQPVVEENMMLLQVEFLKRSLGMTLNGKSTPVPQRAL